VRNIEKCCDFSELHNYPYIGNNSGLTLIELLISIVILSIIMIGLNQVMETAISAHDQTTGKQELLARARYGMERMVMFVQETDYIDISSSERLEVSERVLNTYNNSTHSYVPDGDEYLDADNDNDGLVNEDSIADPRDPIIFELDKTDSGNWKLQEQMVNYSTGTPLDDLMAKKVLAEHVTLFRCQKLGTNLVEIELTLDDGENEVSLKTRVKAMHVD
jgi:prepilin-type N-terminal cleavage/methylation domain-containing protein